jgi:hypothetical protein
VFVDEATSVASNVDMTSSWRQRIAHERGWAETELRIQTRQGNLGTDLSTLDALLDSEQS